MQAALNASSNDRLDADAVEALLVRATHEQRLPRLALALLALDSRALDEVARARAERALETCVEVARVTRRERERLQRHAARAGIQLDRDTPDALLDAMQLHRFELRVQEAEALAMIEVAEESGFRRWQPWQRGAWKAYAATHTSVTLVKADSGATRVTVRWDVDPRRGSRRSWLTPTEIDLGLVELPNSLWRGYHAIRLARAMKEKVTGPVAIDAPSPFLGTPMNLIAPLLDFAALREDDVLLDLGSGDGRVVIETARRHGCQTIGIERDASLVEQARRDVEAHGLTDRVRIEHGDLHSCDVRRATVVFLFLAPLEVKVVLSDLLTRLAPGTRIVAHEQLALNTQPAPDRTELMLGTGSLTVAQMWRV